MYRFKCDLCGRTTSKILSDNAAAKAWAGTACVQGPGCWGQFKRDARPATSRVTEVLDNGIMARRVERPADAERVYYEHTHRKTED